MKTPENRPTEAMEIPADEIREVSALVHGARAGSTDALSRLYVLYADTVFRLAYRFCGSRHDAEDVLQDLFVALPEALRSYEECGRFEPWLKKVTVRTALMKSRARKARREDPIEWVDSRSAPRRSTAEVVTLRRAIERLPDSYRRVFVLKEIEGYSHEEIGELLGISAEASATRLHRARKRLRRAIER